MCHTINIRSSIKLTAPLYTGAMFSGKLQLRVVSASLAALGLGRGELHCYTRITVDTRELGETEVIYASDRWIQITNSYHCHVFSGPNGGSPSPLNIQI